MEPAVPAEQHLPIQAEQDIVAARQTARETAKRLGFGMVDQSRIATAVSELTRNVVRYATEGRGEVLIELGPSPIRDCYRLGLPLVLLGR